MFKVRKRDFQKNRGETLSLHLKIFFLQFFILLSSSALAEQCLQCSSIMSDKDQTKVPTAIQPTEDFGPAGKNCFTPIGDTGLPMNLSSMKRDCSSNSGGTNNGCYSLAYSIKSMIESS